MDEPNDHAPQSGGWPLSGGQTLAVVIVAVAAVFILQNTDEVTIEFFTVSVSAPQWLVMTGLFVVGLLAGVLLQRRRARSA